MTAYTLGLACPHSAGEGGSPQPPADLPPDGVQHLSHRRRQPARGPGRGSLRRGSWVLRIRALLLAETRARMKDGRTSTIGPA